MVAPPSGPPLTPGPYPPFGLPPRRRSWVPLAILAMLVAIFVLLLLAVLFPAVLGIGPVTREGVPLIGVFGVLFLVFLGCWVALWAVRIGFWRSRGRSGGRGPWGPGGPEDRRAVWIARQRYARGEISREQYLQIVQDLQASPGHPPPPSPPVPP